MVDGCDWVCDTCLNEAKHIWENYMARYALRMETADGTLEDAYHYMSRKADALQAARRAAKHCACLDVVRVHVDDTSTEIGIAAFDTRNA